MDIKLKDELLHDRSQEAAYLKACALAVFEDWLHKVEAQEFEDRFGIYGSQCLAKTAVADNVAPIRPSRYRWGWPG